MICSRSVVLRPTRPASQDDPDAASAAEFRPLCPPARTTRQTPPYRGWPSSERGSAPTAEFPDRRRSFRHRPGPKARGLGLAAGWRSVLLIMSPRLRPTRCRSCFTTIVADPRRRQNSPTSRGSKVFGKHPTKDLVSYTEKPTAEEPESATCHATSRAPQPPRLMFRWTRVAPIAVRAPRSSTWAEW